MSGDVECDYCGGAELAYELRSDRGQVTRCIPCLAVKQGQQQFSMPFEEFINNSKHEDTRFGTTKRTGENTER